MTPQKPKRLSGSSVARIAGNILSGMLANQRTVVIGLKEQEDAWGAALWIAQKAEAYDAEGEK